MLNVGWQTPQIPHEAPTNQTTQPQKQQNASPQTCGFKTQPFRAQHIALTTSSPRTHPSPVRPTYVLSGTYCYPPTCVLLPRLDTLQAVQPYRATASVCHWHRETMKTRRGTLSGIRTRACTDSSLGGHEQQQRWSDLLLLGHRRRSGYRGKEGGVDKGEAGGVGGRGGCLSAPPRGGSACTHSEGGGQQGA